MKKLHRLVLAVSLVPLVSFMTAGRGESAEAAGCTKNDDCEDNDPCTKDKCDQDAGRCEFKPHDFGNHYGQPIACDDGNACTSADVCHAGVCAGVNVPDGTECTDPDTCLADVCAAGVCGHDGDAREVIVFASSRDNPVWPPPGPQFVLEIYLMNADTTNPVRLTNNLNADSMPALSPDGKGRIIFDSNRLRVLPDKINTSDLFVMRDDGSMPTFLTRGSSATWSPDSKSIAFHRSASGTGQTIRIDLGAPTSDSDIFVGKMCDLLAGVPPTNLTNSPTEIDDDASWSPDGQKIVWTAHDVGDDPLVIPSQEIYVMNADGSGRVNLTNSVGVEERGPAWSPDGMRIAYMCRVGKPATSTGPPTFEICVMNADGSDPIRLTSNTLPDGTPTWSPDGTRILFSRAVPPPNQQLHIMNADGSDEPAQITFPPGFNLFASFGEIKARP